MAGEQFSLCWDNFHKNMSAGMHALLENEDLVDVTIAIEGKYLKAHKMVLSVCSPYFKELFQSSPCKHPIVFLKDVSYVAMNDLLTFMYQGEVQVNQEHLTAFIKTAEALQVKGLTGEAASEPTEIIDDTPEEEQIREIDIKPTTPRPKKLVPYSNKRPRHTSNTESKMPKLDHCTPSEIIQFKMEPFEGGQTHHEEHFQAIDDSHPDGYRDTLDETQLEESHIDDPEDYSMLEGEEEPKPGTSADPGGDSQVKSEFVKPLKPRKRRPSPQKVIHKGFVYHLRLQHHGRTRYFRCSKERYTGCTATAKLDTDASSEDLMVIRPHNHPPDATVEIKACFENQLRRAVQNLTSIDVKSIYNSVAAIYPESAIMFPFGPRLNCKMKRWRRTYLES